MPTVIYSGQVEGESEDRRWEWFGGMTITTEENGDTTISGPVADQPALRGLLVKVRDLGLTLVALACDDMPERRTND